MSEQGIASENREYSYPIVKKYRFLERLGKRLLKTKFNFSSGCVAFIKLATQECTNWDSISKHYLQFVIISRISAKE